MNNLKQKIISKIKRLILKPAQMPAIKTSISSSSIFKDSTIEDYSYISPNTIIQTTDIGKYCSIGPGTIIGFGEHPSKYLSTSPMFYHTGIIFDQTFAKEEHFQHHSRVTIKNDVWIGANVYIKNGITIGNGAIIAAGCVVTKDVPNYAIFGGVPGKLLQYRFSESIINKLNKLSWWNLSENLLATHSEYFNKNLNEEDLDKLILEIKNEVGD